MHNLKLLIATILGTLIIILGSAWALSKLTSSPADSTMEVPMETLMTPGAPVKGASESARFTLVEFSDFQCPACASARPQVMALLAQYPDDLRLVYRHFPLTIHPNADEAAKAAEAAARFGKFWEMHDALFLSQKDWERDNDPLSFFVGLAQKFDISEQDFILTYESQAISARVNEDANLATQLKLQFTPSFFLNGKLVSLEEVATQIKQELGR